MVLKKELTLLTLALSSLTGITSEPRYTVRAIPVHDIGNAVEVAADGLQGQGWDVFQIQNTEYYYPDGTEKVLIWIKGVGEPPVLEIAPGAYDPNGGCPDYNPSVPLNQGPFAWLPNGGTCTAQGYWTQGGV